MLIKQIDHIGPESLERGFSNLFDAFGAAIQIAPPRFDFGSGFETELGGYDHLLAKRSERFTDEFFVRVRTINFGGVKKCDAAFNGRPNQCDHLLFVARRTYAKVIPIQPSPMAETSRLVFPSLRFFIFPNSESALAINYFGHSDLSEAMSMEKRYFTSDLSNRS